MTADEFKAAREKLKKTQAEMAELLGAGVDAVSSWEQGRRPINTITHLAVDHLLLLQRKRRRRKKA